MTEPSITLTGDSAVALREAKDRQIKGDLVGASVVVRILAGMPQPEPVDPAAELCNAVWSSTMKQAVVLIRAALDKARAEGAESGSFAIEHMIHNSPKFGPDYPGHPIGEQRDDCQMCEFR